MASAASAALPPGFDITAQLASLSMPVLVTTGTSDFFAGVADQHVADFEPDAQLELTSQAGHFPWMEQPEAAFVVITSVLAANSR